MDFIITLRDLEAKQAQSLHTKVRLQDVFLYKCEADGAGPPSGPTEPVQLSAEISSSVEQVGPSRLDFAVTLEVSCHEQLTFHVHATFLVRYQITESFRPAKKDIEAFRKSHVVLAAWPYLREFVQNLTARMGFATEALPVLRLVSQRT